MLLQSYFSDSEITSLMGLEPLKALKTLSIAQNQIEEISETVIDSLVNLQSLNVSANPLGSMLEVEKLRRLPNLKEVYFYDPHYGACPVCFLGNFWTCALSVLKKVTILDYTPVKADDRNDAEQTVSKKRMYYNMRINSLKRNTTKMLGCCTSLQRKRGAVLDAFEMIWRRRLADLRAYRTALASSSSSSGSGSGSVSILTPTQLSASSTYPANTPSPEQSDPSPAYFADLSAPLSSDPSSSSSLALNALQKLESVLVGEVVLNRGRMEGARQLLSLETQRLRKEITERLILELESGGNVRVEEGRVGDAWVSQMTELVRLRFQSAVDYAKKAAETDVLSASKFDPFGLRNVSILNISRVHNRHLRNRFEEMMQYLKSQPLPPSADKTKQKPQVARLQNSVHYLFFVEPVDGENQLDEIIINGFPVPVSSSLSSTAGRSAKDEGICLSNSLTLLDRPRLSHWARLIRTVDSVIEKQSSASPNPSSSSSSSPDSSSSSSSSSSSIPPAVLQQFASIHSSPFIHDFRSVAESIAGLPLFLSVSSSLNPSSPAPPPYPVPSNSPSASLPSPLILPQRSRMLICKVFIHNPLCIDDSTPVLREKFPSVCFSFSLSLSSLLSYPSFLIVLSLFFIHL